MSQGGAKVWFDTGVASPIVVPSSTSCGQPKAMQELLDGHA